MLVPFHIPSLPKPQIEYNIDIDNANTTPFPHPYLAKYGSQSIRPVLQYDPLTFVYLSSSSLSLTKPTPIESTPFKLIETRDDLCNLATKLSEVDEFAVDLEHNSYRSFQGITCLMQISTRKEDFIVDTLKLRDHIRDYLGEVFQDPNKRKVMHGATNDILWLQRDFNIYVCNLFDTMQASRVMGLERNSLEYLLRFYCGVTANKEYQTSDWRLRPLPYDMVKYAREDTHYLLYIHDRMTTKLFSEYGNLLGDVFRKSFEVCSQLYQKEHFDRTISYLYLYGLQESNLDAKQLAVVSALFEWRDKVAREDDESTGYILPNQLLLEIAKRLPLNKEQLLEIVGFNKPHVLRDAHVTVKGVQLLVHDDANTAMFKGVSRLLKQKIPVPDIVAKVKQAERGIHRNPERLMMYSNLKCQPSIFIINPVVNVNVVSVPYMYVN